VARYLQLNRKEVFAFTQLSGGIMRVRGFYLSVFLAASVLALLMVVGMACQKPESVNTKTSKTNLNTKVPAYDSAMLVDKAIPADAAVEKNDTSAMSKKSNSMVMASATGYYTCSMHPQVHQIKAGKCPICGMDLVFKKVTTTAIKAKNTNLGKIKR
jgi:hypothetical protein